MKAGKYKNTDGAELILTVPLISEGSIWALGEIWWAESTGGFLIRGGLLQEMGQKKQTMNLLTTKIHFVIILL